MMYYIATFSHGPVLPFRADSRELAVDHAEHVADHQRFGDVLTVRRVDKDTWEEADASYQRDMFRVTYRLHGTRLAQTVWATDANDACRQVGRVDSIVAVSVQCAGHTAAGARCQRFSYQRWCNHHTPSPTEA